MFVKSALQVQSQSGFRIGVSLAGLAVVGCFLAATLLSGTALEAAEPSDSSDLQISGMQAISADQQQ